MLIVKLEGAYLGFNLSEDPDPEPAPKPKPTPQPSVPTLERQRPTTPAVQPAKTPEAADELLPTRPTKPAVTLTSEPVSAATQLPQTNDQAVPKQLC